MGRPWPPRARRGLAPAWGGSGHEDPHRLRAGRPELPQGPWLEEQPRSPCNSGCSWKPQAWQLQFRFSVVYDKGPTVPHTDPHRHAQRSSLLLRATGLRCSGRVQAALGSAGSNPQRASALHPHLLCSPLGRSWVTFTSAATTWLLQVVQLDGMGAPSGRMGRTVRTFLGAPPHTPSWGLGGSSTHLAFRPDLAVGLCHLLPLQCLEGSGHGSGTQAETCTPALPPAALGTLPGASPRP